MKKVEKRFLVVEDNGGGLTLVVFGPDGNVQYLNNMYEYHPQDLVVDLEAVRNGDDVSEWDGCVDDPQEFWETQFDCKYGWCVIADNDGIYYDKMGHAGQNAFARRDD